MTYLLKPKAEYECKRCLFDDSIAVIYSDGICEYCKLHDRLEKNAPNWQKTLVKIRSSKGKYNCLIGISGGLDSSTLLWLAVNAWHLKPLVIHFNNNYNSKEAKHNIKSLIDKLGVDFIMYRVNQKEYDRLNEAFLQAGVPDADIPNDIAMAKLMYETAKKYGIKWILNGHDFRTEGSTPKPFTYMDARYVQSVYETHTGGKKLTNYPLYTFWDQLMQGWLGIKQVRPFHDNDVHAGRGIAERLMIGDIGWRWYGAKHGENIYTEFVGACLLPVKFGIDKRLVYLSARVRSGQITKDEAIKELMSEPKFDTKKLDSKYVTYAYSDHFSPRSRYKRYNFKRHKWLLFILYKMGIVPYTFYVKYT